MALPLVSLLIIMLLIEKKQRKEWVRKQRWWIIFGWASWTAVLVSVILVADSAKKDAWWWLGDSLLRGLSALGNVVWTPWFVLFVIILAAYGRQVRDLLNRLARNVKTLEVSGVKVSLGDPTPVVTGLAVGWWSDKPEPTGDTADAAGSDGPMQNRPLGPDPAYERCLEETPGLLAGMTQENHWECGKKLRALEWSWIGEYAEQLEQSTRLLRQAIRDKRVQVYTYRYLATGLPVRHMMLYMYGRLEHAEQFFADLPAIDRPSLIYVLKEPITFWFLVYLCDRKQFHHAQRLVGLGEFMNPDLTFSGQALQTYLYLKQGQYEQAACQAAAYLNSELHSSPDVALPRIVLHYAAAMANLKVNIPTETITHAMAILRDDAVAAYGLRTYLRRHAIRLYSEACYQLKQYEQITQLMSDEPEAALDPYVLNALAVARHTEGDTRAAASFLMRAMDLLPPAGEDELRQTILTNHRLVNE